MKYKLEIWSYGNLAEVHESDDITKISKIYINCLSNDSVGVKLFIDGSEIKFLKIRESLGLGKEIYFK